VSAPKRSFLVDAFILLALALIAVVGYKYSPLLLPKADLEVKPEAGCDLNRAPCRAEFAGGSIELAIEPRPVPVIRPMQVSATIAGIEPSKVEIDFAGVTMNMGYNRVTLDAVPDAPGPGRYSGQATIPVCITGRMGWQATLMIEAPGKRISVPFLFDAPLEGGG
jgi:hypothetical protein